MWRTAAAALRGGLPLRPTQPSSLALRVLGDGESVAASDVAVAGMATPLQVRWAKKGKRKKRTPQSARTAEQKAASAGPPIRLEDHFMTPETPFAMASTIRQHMRGLMSDGRQNIRRKKDLSRYTHHRVLRIAGMTHDNPQEDIDRRGFVTPLTEMQDAATLPRSALHRRFNFPHVLNYKVYWGPPSVQDEPNAYEGSMVGCSAAMRLDDLPLTQRQKERLVDIVGHDRIDEKTGVVSIEVDDFAERNHNAALLGDMVEKLLREVTAVEDGLPSSASAAVKSGHTPATGSPSGAATGSGGRRSQRLEAAGQTAE